MKILVNDSKREKENEVGEKGRESDGMAFDLARRKSPFFNFWVELRIRN